MSPKRSLARLSVWLGQTLVGSLIELANDRSLFTFDQDYVADPLRPVLSLSYRRPDGTLNDDPVVKQIKLAPFFSNLLPEGELRRHIAKRAGVKEVRDFPLLELLGEDLPGAVVVRNEGDGPLIEEPAVESRPGEAAVDRPLRFSLAGVQMKLSATGSPTRRLTIPAEGRGGHWILKLPSKAYPRLPENEHSMMRFAQAVGIEVAETGLVPMQKIENIPTGLRQLQGDALWVKRFDRTDANARVHMEDFNQVYAQLPDDKYANYSYTNMAADLAGIAGVEAVREFVRRLVFSAAIGNADMHLKNWTLLYPDGRTPRLSPAYDLVATIAYIDDVTMALSVAKEKDVRNFDEALLRRFAARVPVPEKLILDAALETAEKIVQVWPALNHDLPIGREAAQWVTDRIKTFPLTARLA
jgi:serine/threonine-protein kinase HipA